MKTILSLLNEIKWDKRKKPKEYVISYFDRINGENIDLSYVKIKKIEDNFIIVDDKNIPLHRIKEVRRNNKVVWQR